MSTEQQTQKIARLLIHPARVKRVLEEKTINGIIKSELESLEQHHGIKEYINAKKALSKGLVSKDPRTGKEIELTLSDDEKAKYQKVLDNAEKGIEEHIEKYNLLKRAKYRISEGATTALAYFSERIATDLMGHAIDTCHAQGKKKQVTPMHFFGGEPEALPTYQLFSGLPTWTESAKKYRLGTLEAMFAKPKKAPKKAKKAAKGSSGTAQDKAGEAPKEAEEGEPSNDVDVKSEPGPAKQLQVRSDDDQKAEPAEEEKTGVEAESTEAKDKSGGKKLSTMEKDKLFFTYVSTIAKNIIRPPEFEDTGRIKGRIIMGNSETYEFERDWFSKYADLRVTEPVKTFVNKIIYEFLAGMSNQLIVELSHGQTKTVNKALVKKIIEAKMVYDHFFSERFDVLQGKGKVFDAATAEALSEENTRYNKAIAAINSDESLSEQEKQDKLSKEKKRHKDKRAKLRETSKVTVKDKPFIKRQYTFKPGTDLIGQMDHIVEVATNKKGGDEIFVLGFPRHEVKSWRRVSYEEYKAEQAKIKELRQKAKPEKPKKEASAKVAKSTGDKMNGLKPKTGGKKAIKAKSSKSAKKTAKKGVKASTKKAATGKKVVNAKPAKKANGAVATKA